MALASSPREQGFRFPAEWEEQEAIWFAWPVREDLWEGCLARVLDQLAELYILASRFQKVCVLCPAKAQSELTHRIGRDRSKGQIELFDYEVDDVWIRDYGPLFLLSADNRRCAIADWRYNAWGDKFPKQAKDDAASKWIAGHLGIERFPVDAVLEGGAVESDGRGRILTTEVVLLNPNRNGAVEPSWVEGLLLEALSVNEVLWLGGGLVGDDTDGHIDNLARFFSSGGILIAGSNSSENPSLSALEENRRRVEAFRTREGAPYEIVTLPLPQVIHYGGEPLAASYMNYLLLNGAVLVPTYDQPERDEVAIGILRDCFPEREVVGFDCRDIIKEGGALHCMSQHQPRVFSA